jgi:hypothetical protein
MDVESLFFADDANPEPVKVFSKPRSYSTGAWSSFLYEGGKGRGKMENCKMETGEL